MELNTAHLCYDIRYHAEAIENKDKTKGWFIKDEFERPV